MFSSVRDAPPVSLNTGLAAGITVTVDAPRGAIKYTVTKIER